MALPEKFNSMNDVPESFREMYAPVDEGNAEGEVALRAEFKSIENLEGALQKEKQQRIERQKRIEQLEGSLKQYEGLDPSKAKEALEELGNIRAEKERLEQERLESEGKHAEAAELKYKGAIADLNNQIEALKGEVQTAQESRNQLFDKYSTIRIDDALRGEFLRQHAKEDVIDDLVIAARQFWKMDGESEEPAAFEGPDQPMYGKTPGERIKMDEFTQGFLEKRPWAIREHAGSGLTQVGAVDSNGVMTVEPGQLTNFSNYMQMREQIHQGKVNIADNALT